MAQAVAYICGFETGDASELGSLAAGASIQGTTVRTGAYALKQAASMSGLSTSLSAAQVVFRGYLQVPALPSANTIIVNFRSSGATNLALRFNASNKLEIIDTNAAWGATTTAGTASFNTAQWYRIEMAADAASSGVIKVWVDGVLDINITHTLAPGSGLVTTFQISGAANPNEYFWDDIRIDTGGVATIGAGQIIARQGTAGTPNHDAWTKNGAATAALCWSDTPFSTATNCSSSTSSAAQNMLVALFSATQSGHGTQVVGSGDTVNGCKMALVGKCAVSESMNLIRRVNGVQSLTAKTFTTSDAYFDDGIWTTTPANLDILEAGSQKAATVNLATVEDAWVIVDYTPAGQAPLFNAEWDIPAPRRYPIENRGFVHDTDIQLVGQDKFYGGPGQAPNVFDWRVPPDKLRARSLADPQNQYVRIVGQESGFTKFTPTWDVPPPRRYPVENRGFIHDTDVHLVGKDTLPKFSAEWKVPAPLRRVATLGEPQAQFNRVIGQETLPKFNAEWKVPPPARRSPSLVETSAPANPAWSIVGQEILPAFDAEWRVPAPSRRHSTLADIQAPANPAWLVVGNETLPATTIDWANPRSNYPAQLRAALLSTTGLGGLTPIPPTPGIISHYGVTAGPEISVHSGTTLLNAHGVGGNQAGLSGAEGIPYDAPQ